MDDASPLKNFKKGIFQVYTRRDIAPLSEPLHSLNRSHFQSTTKKKSEEMGWTQVSPRDFPCVPLKLSFLQCFARFAAFIIITRNIFHMIYIDSYCSSPRGCMHSTHLFFSILRQTELTVTHQLDPGCISCMVFPYAETYSHTVWCTRVMQGCQRTVRQNMFLVFVLLVSLSPASVSAL